MFTEILLLLILILINAFFAASEIALISLNDNKIRIMAEEGNKKAKMLRKLLSEPSRFLATIQIGITLAGFMASAFAAESFSGRLVNTLKSTGIPVPDSVLKTFSMVVITIILSYFSLVLGELVPKRFAMQKADAIAMWVVRPLNVLSSATGPFVKFLTTSTNFFVRLMGVDPDHDEEQVTEEEIRMMVDVGEEKGAIHVSEKEMINNIFEFNNKTVSEVMTHRTAIAALPVTATLEETLEFCRTEKYSRIPVYEDSIDNIVGIMHFKYLIRFMGADEETEAFDLRKLIRPPYFVPDSKPTDILFKELQKSKTHLAVVVDEYGGTAGIVSLEDLIEEIVGNILDEDDEDEREIEQPEEGVFVIRGTTSLDAVSNHLGVELPVDDYETLSGFVVGQLGRIPANGERPEVTYASYLFTVEEISDKRVVRVRVTRTVPETVEEETEQEVLN